MLVSHHNSFPLQNAATLQFQKVKKAASRNLTMFDWGSYSQPDLGRQAQFYFSSGSNITDDLLSQVCMIKKHVHLCIWAKLKEY